MSENLGKRKRGRKQLTEDSRWSDRELMDFAAALQRYGSGDTQSIALAVKTKSESAIKAFITKEVNKTKTKLFRVRRSEARPMRERARGWPCARKWQKIAQNQMLGCHRKKDYSSIIIPQIWEKFRDEQPPPASPQCVDVRAIYAYVCECLKGERSPPELPPKEAAILLMLLRLMREMMLAMDISEEKEFVRNFRQATKFVPFKVKDEFKKKGHIGPVVDPDCVSIPEEVYLALSRHRRLVQSFNPLAVPLWLIEKEQEFLAHMFDTPLHSPRLQ